MYISIFSILGLILCSVLIYFNETDLLVHIKDGHLLLLGHEIHVPNMEKL